MADTMPLPAAPRRFGYCRDPLFLAAFAAYLANKFWLKRVFASGFCHDYANDVLCLPVCLPLGVAALRWLGVRRHEGPPTPREAVLALAAIAGVFEWLLPHLPRWAGHHTADPWDVFCYAAGGAAALWWWHGRTLPAGGRGAGTAGARAGPPPHGTPRGVP